MRGLLAASLLLALSTAAPLRAAVPFPAAGVATLVLGGTSGAPGARVTSEAILTFSGGALVSGLQLDVFFDSSRLKFFRVRAGEAATEAGKQVVSNLVAPGDVRIVMLGGDAALHSGVPFLLDFDILETAPSGPTMLEPRDEVAVDPSGNPVLLDVVGSEVTVTGGLLTGCCGMVIPAAASAEGIGGSVWKTRLLLENAGTTPVAVGLLLLPAGGDNSQAEPKSVSLAAGELVSLDDVVATTFDAYGKAGAILVDSDSAQVRATSRTYNTGSGAGTFGQGIPAVPFAELFLTGEVARLFPVDGGSASRTNLGLLNATPRPASFRVRLLDAKGIVKTVRTIDLPAWGWTQENDLVRAWGVALGDGGRIQVDTSTAGVRFASYLSVVDNTTGDPAYLPAQH